MASSVSCSPLTPGDCAQTSAFQAERWLHNCLNAAVKEFHFIPTKSRISDPGSSRSPYPRVPWPSRAESPLSAADGARARPGGKRSVSQSVRAGASWVDIMGRQAASIVQQVAMETGKWSFARWNIFKRQKLQLAGS